MGKRKGVSFLKFVLKFKFQKSLIEKAAYGMHFLKYRPDEVTGSTQNVFSLSFR